MGIVGRGHAFNFQFMPRAFQFRTDSFWQRPYLMRPNSSVFINEKVQIGPTGFWGFMTGLSQSLFGGGMYGFNNFLGWNNNAYAYLNTAQGATTSQGTTTQTASGEDKYLKSLTSVLGSKGTFAKHPDKDGFYIMTTKNGEVIEDTYQNLIDRFKKTPEAKKDPDVEKEPEAKKDPDVEKEPEAKKELEVKKEPEAEVEHEDDGGKTKVKPGTSTRTWSVQNPKSNGEVWTKEKMAKPYRLNMTVDMSIGDNSTATVVTPDGKTYKVTTRIGLRGHSGMNTLASAMQQKLTGIGWTNVTLENKNFDWASDGSKATGNVDKPAGAEKWTDNKKAQYNKPFTINFAVRTNAGNSGSATVTTPDGQLYQVTTTSSFTASRARKDLVKQMIDKLVAAGWKNASVTNPNWPDDCQITKPQQKSSTTAYEGRSRADWINEGA